MKRPKTDLAQTKTAMSRTLAAGFAVGLSVGLSACAVPSGQRVNSESGGDGAAATAAFPTAACPGDLGATGNTRLAAIQQQVSDGKPYAALAELDALGARTPKAQWLRAEALRRVDRHDQARQIYAELTQSCLNGEAQHGLGLMAGREGRLTESLLALRAAKNSLPTNAAIRNDLGYALLLDGQWADARFELLTALELAPGDSRVQRNLVLLALAQDKAVLARELSERFGLDAAAQERLGLQAKGLVRTAPALPHPSTNEGTSALAARPSSP